MVIVKTSDATSLMIAWFPGIFVVMKLSSKCIWLHLLHSCDYLNAFGRCPGWHEKMIRIGSYGVFFLSLHVSIFLAFRFINHVWIFVHFISLELTLCCSNQTSQHKLFKLNIRLTTFYQNHFKSLCYSTLFHNISFV